MRLTFLILLLINIALYPLVSGLIGRPRDGAEPLRLASQIQPERIRLVAPDSAPPVAGDAAPAEQPDAENTPAVAGSAPACVVLSGLVRTQVDALGERIREQQVAAQLSEAEQTETTAWWVNIPDLSSRQLADRKMGELRALGVRDMLVMAQPEGTGSAQQLAISLGLFKTEAAANELLATLTGQGVRSAVITPREGKAGHFRVELRGARPALDGLLSDTRDMLAGIAPADCP
jgi:cell division septation protein DedD